jgi:hypothetical protein
MATVDRAVDLATGRHALGATLYELLVLRRIMEGRGVLAHGEPPLSESRVPMLLEHRTA